MCGIVGIADFRGDTEPDPGLVASMAATLTHRGPDDACVLAFDSDDRLRFTFGFRRLSIVDFGAGARSFADESGRLRVICNGEIYNAPELRRDLEARGHRFETRCDTEVVPHLYEEHGLEFVSRISGMFALAIFDPVAGRLVLVRDRAGEKPLYYIERNDELLFASEIKALLAHPGVSREPDIRALTRYLLYGYFPAPHTPFRGVRKLPAGHLLIAERGAVRLERYWDLRLQFDANGASLRGEGGASPRGGSGASQRGESGARGESPEVGTRPGGGRPPAAEDEAEAAIDVRRLLRDSVALRMRADVEAGIFFSGGIDSSCIAALAIEVAGRPVPTFTLGMEDEEFNEAGQARRAAAHLGTEHHEMTIGEGDMLRALLRMARTLDEPLADASVIPTYLLSEFTRRHVKVALGGEGGDELFAGYPTYLGHRLARHYNRLPRPLRDLVKRGVEAIPPSFGNVGVEFLLKRFAAAAELPDELRHQIWFGAFGPDRQRQILSDSALSVLASAPPDDPLEEARAVGRGRRFRDPLDALLLTDFVMYLQENLLTKVDRASMAASLEVRAPFLHHPLVEYVAGLPAEMKLRGLTGKRVLRRAFADRLSRETLTRRKRGFNIPLARFLQRGLAPLASRAFDPERVARGGLLRPEAVAALWREHRERRRDHGRQLWNLLMLQLWHSRHFGDGDLLSLS